jgi:PIN domain nuclease of toxin-antitoxin system
MPTCTRWERLVSWAEKEENSHKALEFKEKLVECIIYTAQEKVRKGKLREAEELLKYGKDVVKRLGIEELSFHISLLEKEIAEVRERRKAQTQAR